PKQRKHVRLGAIVGMIGGNTNRKRLREQMICVDGGSSFEVMYEHCFRNLRDKIKAKLKEFTTPLVGFSGEACDAEGTTNRGREESPGHTNKDEEPDDTIQPSPIPSKDTQINEKGMGKGELHEKSLEDRPPEKVVIHDEYPDQTIIIRGKLSPECRSELIEILRKHADAFALTPTDMTGIPRFNVRATYQRLVDTIFEGQMGRNLEAYVDDMVIKRKTQPEMIKDVEETLLTLKKVNMKLNLKKCSFRMVEGKFLGYIVTSEGIRANL
ncbi:hypothetical protein Tco_1179054, partial [Tanacetum coccineum]